MTESTNNVKRKRGRPLGFGKEGAAAFIGLRLPKSLLKRVDEWTKRGRIGQRSEAIRQLIERGLLK